MNEFINKGQEMETEQQIDLMRIINNMWKGSKKFGLLIILLVITLGAVSYMKAKERYSPVYTASATFIIGADDSSIYSSNSYLNQRTASQIVTTFPYLLNTGILQKKVMEELGTTYIPGSISTQTLGSTSMITMNVTSSIPEDAYNVLEAVIKHYPEVAEPVIGAVKMTMLDTSGVPETPINPPSYKNSILSGMKDGLMIGIVILLIYTFTRNTIYEEVDFRKKLDRDCICTIPQIIFKRRGKKFRKDISIYNKKISQTFLEAVRVLRARIEKEAKKNDLKVFLVTSAAAGEGKSTIAANTAMALAMRDSKVVLVDCDLRNPSVRERLNLAETGKGLYEYLSGEAELEDILQWNEEYKMYIVPGGYPINNASELLDSKRMRELMEKLKEKAEYIILDTAPIGVLTDTVVLADVADAALFVVKQDYAYCPVIRESLGQLAESKIYIAGCILNGARAGIGGYGYKNYRYYNKYGNYLAESHYGKR